MIGFYIALDREFYKCRKINNLYKEEEKIRSSWGYISNQNGGFLCYYFFSILNYKNYSYYLQIEKINIKTKKEIEEEKKHGIKSLRNT